MSTPGVSRRRKVVPVVVGLAVAVLTFAFVLPRFADYRDVWELVRELSSREILALVGATALSIATVTLPWQIALPGLRFVPALAMTQAAAALTNVVPGGGAVGMAAAYGMLRNQGFAVSQAARAITLTRVWNAFANLTYPIVSVFVLAVSGQSSAALATAAFVGAAVLGVAVAAFVLALASGRMARDLGDVAARATTWALAKVRRPPVVWDGNSVDRFRRSAVDLLRRRWHVLTFATLVWSLSVFLVLLVSLRVLGVPASEVTVVEAFAAWSLVRVLTSLPTTPGDVGVAELGLTATLVGFGGPNASVVAAVLVYRFLTLVPTTALGLLGALTWRRRHPS